MPYETGRGGFERARRLGHVPVVENEMVQDELQELETREPEVDEVPLEEHSVHIDDLENQVTQPKLDFVFSFDGSRHEVEVKEKFPANRIGFVQTSAVLTEIAAIEEQRQTRLVDPARIKQITDSSLLQVLLPSTNYRREGTETTHESFRQHLFESVFKTREIEGISLLDWYGQFIELTDRAVDNQITLKYCPIDNDCEESDIRVPLDEPGQCTGCGKTVYPTDRLRIHERVNDQQTNETAITNVMNLLEHLSLAAYLRFIQKNSPRRLEKTGFICDGPLAQFDTGAWFHDPLLQNIQDVYESQSEEEYAAPPIVGIEKSGQFVAHAKHIEDELDPGTILWMDDEYIYDHIIISRNTDTYGEKTYYGQKFIYKSNSGRVFVLNIPKNPLEEHEKYSPHGYPQMTRTLEMIEEVETALYEDGLIPVAMANEYASIPLKTGSRVLELLSRNESSFSG